MISYSNYSLRFLFSFLIYVLNGMPNGRYTLPALVYTGLANTVGVDKIIRIILSSVGPMSPYIHEVLS